MQINVMTPIVINAIIFGIMSVSVGTSLGGSDYFWLTLFLMVLTGATTGFFQVAVFAEASRFPPQYVQAVMSGQGIAGVSVAISSILSTLTTTPLEKNDSTTTSDHQLAALIYFSSALMVTVAALAGRIILTRQPFYNYHLQHKVTSDDVPINELRQLVGKSAKLLFTVAFVFIVTLMIFPSITSLIKSNTTTRHSRFNDDDLFVAMHFLIFNVGDWIGRVLPLYLSTFDPLLLLIMAGARVVFIPVFLVCNIVVASERSLPVLISSDGIYFLLLGVFSMTSGWICSLTMMAAPQQPFLHTAVEKSQMGSLMSFALVVGLAIGGCLSFWTRTLV
ncbi:nucleoside transporter-domain-containing protein [Chlamydoabsidia padenii]|nr:nucleoside transporter-domain-containing protein [Chlamydoabsidia padenii]